MLFHLKNVKYTSILSFPLIIDLDYTLNFITKFQKTYLNLYLFITFENYLIDDHFYENIVMCIGHSS